MCTISRNKFKRHYLKNKKLLVDCLLYFWNMHVNGYCWSARHHLEHFEKKQDEYPSLIILEIMDCERGGYLHV